ncbi:unnamed protein product [Peniophora sp. CBMAI 1063]|nr:unnamed protein product [Peniophora sp. CBMAI 1063]
MSSTAQGLPHDILHELFEHLAVVDPVGPLRTATLSCSLGWITATHVCARWREVGLGLATLWANVVCAFPSMEIADELLLRARDCPLNIAVGHLDDEPEYDTRDTCIYISWGLQHIERADTFRCDMGRWSTFRHDHPAAYAALTSALPHCLKHLYLVCEDIRRDMPLPLIQLLSSVLLTASFRNILPDPSCNLNALRSLALDVESVAPLPPILAALRRLDNLEDLQLTSRSYFATLVFDYEVVQLKRLKVLHALCNNEQHAADVLECISAPTVFEISVELDERLCQEQTLAKAFARYQERSPRSGSISISESALEMESDEPDRTRLGLSWSPRAFKTRSNGLDLRYTAILLALPVHSDLSRFTRCRLWCPDREIEIEKVDAALIALRNALSCVRSLTLSNATDPTNLRTLFDTSDGDGGELVPLPFPSLETLCFGGGHGSPYHVAAGTQSSTRREGPAPSWWIVLQDLLLRRSQRGAPLRCLRLEGKWCEHESWADEGLSEDFLTRGLVSEFTDKREYILNYSSCKR